MGLISFIKDAGKKLFDRDADEESKIEAIKQHITSFNLGAKEVYASFDGDDTVTMKGVTDTLLERRRIVATVGNIDGVEKVDDQIVVRKAKEDEAGEPEDAVEYYEVKSGDTLSAIALDQYGDASKYPVIFEANTPMLKDPDEIYPGQKLVIPKIN